MDSQLINRLDKRRLSRAFAHIPPLRWILKMTIKLLAPRHYVGAVGAVFNDAGQILLVEHVFRTDFPWGLPGGWVERGESPARAVQREIEEELKLRIEVKQLLFSEPIGLVANSSHPPHLGLAYYCRLLSGEYVLTPEILSIEWADPSNITQELAPFQRRAALLAKEMFELDQIGRKRS